MPGSCVVIQRYVNRLEKWANKNLMKSNDVQYQVLQLGKINPMHQERPSADQLESSFAENLGVLVDNKLNTNQQYVPLWQRRLKPPWLY